MSFVIQVVCSLLRKFWHYRLNKKLAHKELTDNFKALTKEMQTMCKTTQLNFCTSIEKSQK